MNRRTQISLLVGSVAFATVVVLAMTLAMTLERAVDPHNLCDTGFSRLSSCTLRWSSTKTFYPSTSASIIQPGSHQTPPSGHVEVEQTSWAVARCPENDIARRLLCATPSAAAPPPAARDDFVSGLPLPRPWFVTTAKASPLIASLHVETPLALATVLGFYRVELTKRGWTENDGAVVALDRASIAFTTTDGPALLRLLHQDDRTIADLSLRKPAAAKADLLARPGQARLMLGNETDEEAVVTINGQTIRLAARAGDDLTHSAQYARKLPDSQKIDLPPGKYKVILRVAGDDAAQNRELEVGADETWGLLVGPAGVPLPVHLY